MHVSYLKSASKRRKVMEEKLRGDFKDRMKGRFMDKQVMFDVRNSQKACQQLDTTKVRFDVIWIRCLRKQIQD